ncbi:hypothetical protein [Nocardia wallacei]|uniref:hypothetical protein n=1 Tax=Nocardia wallacei TaxID=480035 RepID=UPI002456931F|nr:hypothetical protein [Nocardia wallacei]
MNARERSPGTGRVTALSYDDLAATEREIAAEVQATAPAGWQAVRAAFAMTVGAQAADIVFAVGERVVPVDPPESVTVLVRRHRELSARMDRGPWWRLLLLLTAGGEPEFGRDYGDEPFPDGQMFTPDVYRADLRVYPRPRLPVWLAAYVGHAGRQARSPRAAAAAARADQVAGVSPVRMIDELPDLPVLWARWAVLSAAFLAVGSERGPRMLPSQGWFESSRYAGSTVHLLPGGRAVLSGGVWNAPELDEVYNKNAEMPKYFAGAPDWVADPVLNPRAAAGLLSFCYWWDDGCWYRGASPAAEQSRSAVPGVWTADNVVDIMSGLLGDRLDQRWRAAAETLVTAAQDGVLTRDTVIDVFGDAQSVDIDAAMYQFSIAGSAERAAGPEMPMSEAIDRVRAYVSGRESDTTGYPLSRLAAERINSGWMVYAPVPRGEIAIARAIFYVADDGVVEHSSSSIAPSEYVAGFALRHRRRRGR